MLIQATSMDLGTCWIGIKGGLRKDGRDIEQMVRDTLHLPATFHVLAMTPLGVASRQSGQRKRVDTESRVHYDRFDSCESESQR